jgi:farnesyl diphosphate synthase
MGAIICELDISLQNKFYDFGIDLGLLFQIQDDIIDETASCEEAGKTTSNDSAKNSFVNLLTLEGAVKSANKIAKKCEKTLKEFDQVSSDLNQLLSTYLYRHQKI